MIHFITGRPREYDWADITSDDSIEQGSFDEFVNWIDRQTDVQLDTETTVVDGPDEHQDREALVIQIGSMDGEDQWVFDLPGLDKEWMDVLFRTFSRTDITFYIHNAKFDLLVIYSVFKIFLNSVHDTFLMSKILNTGLELAPGYHSLKGLLNTFFGITLEKEEQTTFNGSPLTKSQLLYAGIDVMFLGDLFEKQKELLKDFELWYLYDEVERKVVRVYAEMEVTPMRFDSTHWLQVASQLEAERDQILKDLNQAIFSDPKLVAYLKTERNTAGIPLIQPYDEIRIRWNSSSQRKLLLSKLVPSLPSTCDTKPEIKKWYKENKDGLSITEEENLRLYLDRNYDDLSEILAQTDKQWLIDNGMFIPTDTILINWNSNPHKLAVFTFYYPNLTDTNSKSLNRISKNELINHFKKYTSAQKRVTSYGENFIAKYVRRDGMICPNNCTQILNTGRISFGILLQIPASSLFRNAFLPPTDDDVFVDSDYSSAEVCIMAMAAGETAFLDAIKNGKDLHSMSASLIFSDKWISIAEPGCQHLIDGSQCKCAEHQKLRKFSKSITFGLAYGLSYHGLAERLDISKQEAKDLIEKFFNTFPKLRTYFNGTRDFSIANEYIRSLLPTGRIRFFAHPEFKSEEEAIGREGQNFGIQETNATILKIALIMLSKEIKLSGLRARLHLPVHDEILSSCHKDDVDELLRLQEKCMIAAGEIFLGPGLLGVDSKILTKWSK